MDAWFNRYMSNHGKTTIIVVGVVLAALYIFLPQTNNANNEVSIYEDEMIVSVDDYQSLQQEVITLQEGMKLLLAGEPQSPDAAGMLRQEMFMCMQNTEDYKDGFLEVSTILTCMGLKLTE